MNSAQIVMFLFLLVCCICYYKEVRTLIFIGILVGGTLGAGVPSFWGNNDVVSPTAGFFSMIGSLLGLLAAIKIGEFYEE